MRRWLPTSANGKSSEPYSNSTIGMLLFMLGLYLMTAMDASVKWLVEDRMHVIQLLFIRSIFVISFLSIFYASRKQLSELKPKRVKAQCIRGFIGFFAPFSFFIALKYLPLTAANVIFFSNIFMITLASALFLKEKVGVYRWSAVAIGYIGVIIAIDPSAEGELFGYIMILIASAAFAYLFVSGKVLSTTESSASLVLFFNLGVGFVSLLWLPNVWQTLNSTDWLGIFMVSIFALFGQFCITKAFALAEASLLAPLNYTTLVLTVIFDWVIWQSVPGAQTFLGAIIIILSSCIVIYRQHKQESA